MSLGTKLKTYYYYYNDFLTYLINCGKRVQIENYFSDNLMVVNVIELEIWNEICRKTGNFNSIEEILN